MKELFTNRKSLFLLAVGLFAPFLAFISNAQPPPDPPPPPLAAPITGLSIAIVILGCIGYGAYTIYKKNAKKVKVA